MKEKVIVYGLGKCWEDYYKKIINDYDVVYCSDRNPDKMGNTKGFAFVAPQRIGTCVYDKLIICNYKYGIREELLRNFEIPIPKIFYCTEIYGDLVTRPEEEKVKCAENLTIIIPTYNRKQRLARTLDLLQMQTNQNFNIIIMDDKSNYDVSEVFSKRSSDFVERITYICNAGNIGIGGNTALAFMQADEGWIWTLSDDDIPSVYAVEIIYQEIAKSDSDIIHFTINDYASYMPKRDGIDFYNLKDMLYFYKKVIEDGKISTGVTMGDFIFFSNKVFHMNCVKKYLKQIITYLYTTIPQNMPIIFMLDNEEGKFRISNKKIVTYSEPDGDHWSRLDNGLGMTILADLPLHISAEERKILYNICMLNYKDVLMAAKRDYTVETLRKLKKMYSEVYFYYLSEDARNEYIAFVKQMHLFWDIDVKNDCVGGDVCVCTERQGGN